LTLNGALMESMAHDFMHLIFTSWGKYDGLLSALQCAQAHCGCPIHVLGEHDYNIGSFTHIAELRKSNAVLERISHQLLHDPFRTLHAPALARWFAIYEYAEATSLDFPIFTADTDFMVFGNLEKAFEPFAQFDFSVSFMGEARTAPYYISRREPLTAFCGFVESLLGVDLANQPVETVSDMTFWTQLAGLHGFNVGNTFEVKDGTVFDHHLLIHDGRFVMGDLGKRIEWIAGYPHFVLRNTKQKIKANTLHCWGPFKNAEYWFLERSQMREFFV